MTAPFKQTQKLPRSGVIRSAVVFCAMIVLLSGCATQSYQYQGSELLPIQKRALSKTEGKISISASALGKDESEKVFGVPLYERGVR